MQPISQWTSTNVVEWMAALNLYRYAELFRSKDIKGVDLLSLDKEKLAVSGPNRSLFYTVCSDAFVGIILARTSILPLETSGEFSLYTEKKISVILR